MRHASLFSGIGGFDLAAEWMGWENVFHCDINPFGKKVLEYYYPNSISYGDITKTDFSIHRGEIDILTGGFPCQPYSHAGKRKGKEDERHLWPQMLRAIREIKPRWIIGENVYGLVNWDGGLVFHEVQSDLEAEGYEVFPYVLPACSINAPHRRDRVFFIAYSDYASTEYSIQARRNVPTSEDDTRTSSDSNRFGCGGRHKQSESDNSKERKIHKNEQQYRNGVWSKTEGCNTSTTDSFCIRLEHGRDTAEVSQEERYAKRKRCQSSLSFETNGNGHKSNWQDFPTVSPICDGDDGISDRLDSITFSKWRKQSIMAGGNAVVPQLIYVLFKTISKFEQLKSKQ
jgi:DNA (cytosine-5)-methyltransferase 1